MSKGPKSSDIEHLQVLWLQEKHEESLMLG